MQELNGYIKLYRKLMQWEWYRDNAVKSLFLHCLISASFKDFDWMGKRLKAGQFITSRKHLAEELGFSEQQIRTAIKKLESTGEITSYATNKFTIVTVNHWSDYQADGDEFSGDFRKEQPAKNAVFCKQNMNISKNAKISTSKSTNKNVPETPVNQGLEESEQNLATSTATFHQPTSNQQITNKQPHRKKYKECKEYKEDAVDARARKNSQSPCAVPPVLTEEENRIQQFLSEVSEAFTELTGRLAGVKDERAILEIAKSTGDTQLVLQAMRESKAKWKPDYDGDRIRTMQYFVPAIKSAIARREAGTGGEAKYLGVHRTGGEDEWL